MLGQGNESVHMERWPGVRCRCTSKVRRASVWVLAWHQESEHKQGEDGIQMEGRPTVGYGTLNGIGR